VQTVLKAARQGGAGAATPAEVRDEVRRRLTDLAPGGGFIFGSIHNIQVNVPPPNIVAMFDTARDEGRYGGGRPVA